MSSFYSTPTHVVATMPTPFGGLPLPWYDYGDGAFTMILITVGLVVSAIAVFASFSQWWGSFGIAFAANLLFGLMTVGSAVGCRADGCILAEALAVAYMWHLAITEVTVCVFAVSACMHVVLIVADMCADARRAFASLSLECRFAVLSAPAMLVMILPMAYVVAAAVFFNDFRPYEYARFVMREHQVSWLASWIVSAILFMPGLYEMVRHELRRDHHQDTSCPAR